MSELTNYIATLFEVPEAVIQLGEFHAAFTMEMNERDKRKWSKDMVAVELLKLGRLGSRGRADQPTRIVKGLAFERPPINRRLSYEVSRFVSGHTVYRYKDETEMGPGVYYVRVLQRPDFSPELYRITYEEIAERLQAAGIRCDAPTVKAIYAEDVARARVQLADPFWNFAETESMRNKSIDTVKDDCIVDFRWRVPGETTGRDAAGFPIPLGSQTVFEEVEHFQD